MIMEEIFEITRNSFPKVDGIEYLHVKKNVEILWDKWGIPHIFAKTAEDTYYSQGYVHARHRLFQMELFRRLVTGELSEIVGEEAMDSDKHYKIIGLHRIAKNSAERISRNQDSQVYSCLNAYKKGVNAGIEKARINPPVEFAALNLKIRDWQIEDSLKVLTFIDWGQSAWNYPMEILREQLISKLGHKMANKIIPLYSGGRVSNSVGSSSWIVNPNKSETGSGLFANDPHLPLTLPAIWFLVHLNCPELNIIGASFPGIPLIIIGHNDYIAFGATNVHCDVIDLFKLELNPENNEQYKYNGEWINFEIIEDLIEIKDTTPLPFKILKSKFGPVVNYFERDDRLYKIQLPGTYALCWSGFGANIEDSLEAFIKVNTASNWDEFREGLKLLTINPINFAYGDIHGNIGLQHGGRIPVRRYGDGATITPGTEEKYNWERLSDFKEMVSIYNPECGFIFNANFNEDKAPKGLLLAQDTDEPYRHRRLKKIFQLKEKFSFQDFIDLQLDQRSEEAAEVLPLMLDNLKTSKVPDKFSDILATLENWDFHMTKQSIAATIYKVWFLKLQQAILRPLIGEEILKPFLGSISFELIRLFKLYENKPMEFKELLLNTFHMTIEFLIKNISKDHNKWKWGNIHKLTLVHPFSQADEDAKILNIGPFKIGGDRNTLNNAYADPLNPFDTLVGPSFRQIHDLSDWNKSKWIIPGGQSGLPFHKHYNDLIKLYVKGKYIPMLFTKEAISRNLEGVLKLQPIS
ncbi:MAG: penicillin acylase family protein [Promethearchaeota archaeon]|nr:MAG: penicillin acylase family protein [Candidatus Lokiarchaeota archaeon]